MCLLISVLHYFDVVSILSGMTTLLSEPKGRLHVTVAMSLSFHVVILVLLFSL